MTTPDRTIITERREWVVRTHGPWGATQSEMHKKLALALSSYRDEKGIEQGTPVFDDAVRVMPRDEEIVVFYEVEVEK